jgi:hypothetical protein
VLSYYELALTISMPSSSIPHDFLATSMPSSQLVASSNRAKRSVSISFSLSISSSFFFSQHHPIYWQSIFNLHLINTLHPTSNQLPIPHFPSSASHTATMKSNYNMLAMAAAAAQAKAMPSQHLW